MLRRPFHAISCKMFAASTGHQMPTIRGVLLHSIREGRRVLSDDVRILPGAFDVPPPPISPKSSEHVHGEVLQLYSRVHCTAVASHVASCIGQENRRKRGGAHTVRT